MFKLKQYIKPYLALLLGAVILLFGQAMLELTLPNYMSDIVNVGLQQGGITSPAPEAIDNVAHVVWKRQFQHCLTEQQNHRSQQQSQIWFDILF